MSGATETLKQLCEQVIAERGPKRFTELVAMLNNELEKWQSGKKVALTQQNPSAHGGTNIA